MAFGFSPEIVLESADEPLNLEAVSARSAFGQGMYQCRYGDVMKSRLTVVAVLVSAAVLLFVGSRVTAKEILQSSPSQLEARVKALERDAAKPAGLIWASGGLEGSKEFDAGTADTVMYMDVRFPIGRFSAPPVVVANAHVDNVHSDPWWGGSKDSFAVTIYKSDKDGFRAVLRRVDPSNKPITTGVILNWIAVSQRPQG